MDRASYYAALRTDDDDDSDAEGTNLVVQATPEPEEEFKLEHEWTLWYDDKPPKGMTVNEYESQVKKLGTFATIQGFWRLWNNLTDYMNARDYFNLRIFKSHISPFWEDEANNKGGKWVLFPDKPRTNTIWSDIVLAVIGEQLKCPSAHLCGVVLSVRRNGDSISLWNADASQVEEIDVMKQELAELLLLSDHNQISYRPHQQSLQFNQSARNAPSDIKRARSPRPLRKSPEHRGAHTRDHDHHHQQHQQQHGHGHSNGHSTSHPTSHSTGHTTTGQHASATTAAHHVVTTAPPAAKPDASTADADVVSASIVGGETAHVKKPKGKTKNPWTVASVAPPVDDDVASAATATAATAAATVSSTAVSAATVDQDLPKKQKPVNVWAEKIAANTQVAGAPGDDSTAVPYSQTSTQPVTQPPSPPKLAVSATTTAAAGADAAVVVVSHAAPQPASPLQKSPPVAQRRHKSPPQPSKQRVRQHSPDRGSSAAATATATATVAASTEPARSWADLATAPASRSVIAEPIKADRPSRRTVTPSMVVPRPAATQSEPSGAASGAPPASAPASTSADETDVRPQSDDWEAAARSSRRTNKSEKASAATSATVSTAVPTAAAVSTVSSLSALPAAENAFALLENTSPVVRRTKGTAATVPTATPAASAASDVPAAAAGSDKARKVNKRPQKPRTSSTGPSALTNPVMRSIFLVCGAVLLCIVFGWFLMK
eukprot:TRINITY_DN3911_c0_g1_i1.p1 TRINITY_DN3911_c0_g1~~TRINITY_DN3911_c0_g1_i1.p1  ORF type:complete len:719 (-),score=173.85 TRINITY_DN3911_c0_g1_i1:8-2164(-)